MRSYLFVPADSQRKLEKALGSDADCLILDLEDSVAPGRKEEARRLACAFLREAAGRPDCPRFVVRVNALSTGLTEADLAGVMAAAPQAILLPKSLGGADVQRLSAMLAVHEAENGLAEGATAIDALVTETPIGVLNAGTYAGKSARLRSLSWGGEDLAAAIGAQSNRDDNGFYTGVFRLARSLTILAAAAAGVEAVDTVFTDLADLAGLEAESAAAVRDGFSGKMAIHPSQVPVINRVFTPDARTLDWADRVVEAFANAGAEAGVLSLDGRMIDRPHLRQAERIIKRAEAAGSR